MLIHFFKKRSELRLDYYDLIDNYFDNIPNCRITSNDDQVDMCMSLEEFDFEYHFLITKRSRVSSLYSLNPDYMNTNMFIDIRPILPQFVLRLILEQIGEICSRFSLSIYVEKSTDIEPFNMFNLISTLSKEKTAYIQEHNECKQYRLSSSKLNDVCQYQALTKELGNSVKTYVKPANYTVLYDKATDEVKLAVKWVEGTSSFFPPYLDYILLEANETLLAAIPAEVFYKYAQHQMYDVKLENYTLKVLYLTDKGALKVARHTNKMRKNVISLDGFSFVSIIDLIEG